MQQDMNIGSKTTSNGGYKCKCKKLRICGVTILCHREIFCLPETKRKNTKVYMLYVLHLTSWRLEEDRRNDTYDCEDYDCHVQPEQHSVSSHKQNTTVKHDNSSGSESETPVAKP